MLDKCSIELKCFKTKTLASKVDLIVFAVVARVTDFEFSFVQMSEVYDDATDLNPTTKRLFKVTLDAIPDIHLDEVPLLDTLTQPFDQIDFVWIGDDITKEECDILNKDVYVDRHDRLIYKQAPSPSISIQETDTVLSAGSHFMVVIEQNNTPTPILDYNLSAPPPPASDPVNSQLNIIPRGFGSSPRLGGPVSPLTDTNASYGSATGKWSKTVGPLMISSIGLKFETLAGDHILSIELDAAIKMGPFAGFVKGFSIGVKLIDLKTIGDVAVSFTGLGLELNRPPVNLTGELLKVDRGFEGGVNITVEPYNFVAAGGYYNKVVDNTVDPPKPFKSMFIFAEVRGPIAELEVASLSGLTGGGGYNSQITLPTIDNVTTFPFLDPGSGKGNDPLSILNGYLSGSWFKPANGPAWIAGGLTIKAFQSLSITAVVVLDLSADVVFGIYADATADFPSDETNETELFARVDIGLLAVIEPAKGTFHAEGQLTPRSFILSKDCHLTGGFALCYWFANSGHEGDWVSTIGGYHSAFVPPPWYPVPPRLAISWKFDDTISIRGEAYFAITPKVCMGGGKLSLAYQSGSLSAHFDAYADFLVNYRPFSFIAGVGVNIDVQYTVDLEFVTHHFHVHLGANVELHGPPLAGVAHVDWSIISFDIHFGKSASTPQKLDWDGFRALLRGIPAVNNDDLKDQITGQGMHAVTATDGLLGGNSDPSSVKPSTGIETLQINKAIFSFRFSTLFPITEIVFAAFAGSTKPSGVLSTYMKPMQIDNTLTVSSILTITISPAAKFDVQWIYKQVPTALWEACEWLHTCPCVWKHDADRGSVDASSSDPSDGKPVSSLLNNQSSTQLQAMGLDLNVPPPTDSPDKLFFNIDYGCSFPASQHSMPGNLNVPNDVTSTAVLDAAINVSYPITPEIPYPPRTVLGRITNPKIEKHELVNKWIQWSGVDNSAPLAKRLADLGSDAQSGYAANWINELRDTPTVPLPVLSAEASLKATMGDGTRFASFGGYRGTGATLNRDWLDGGYA